MPKLVAIGDSLTQGVQSGAIVKTKLSYPALIARSMGLDVPNDFRVPYFPGSGLPLNIEWLLRSMRTDLGVEIDIGEWMVKFPMLLAEFTDVIEDLYERDERETDSTRPRYQGFYHNLAVSGFRVYDSFTVNAAYCHKQIRKKEGWLIKDDFLQLPSAPMYRIAQHVLCSSKLRWRKRWTQIDNLKYLNKKEGPVENLILFLGANDCLRTVMDLEVRDMLETSVPKDPQKRRDKYNLTSAEVFEQDYKKMVQQISKAISCDTKVFVGTVPHVTIPPITQGIPGTKDCERNGQRYFTYYGPFFAKPENFSHRFDKHLTIAQVKKIDSRIDAFNCIIKKVICAQNKKEKERWYIVDICSLLDRLAVKRNKTKAPGAPLRDLLMDRKMSNHELLRLDPIPSVCRFETGKKRCETCGKPCETCGKPCQTIRGNQRIGGGLFSLDCIHPTTIGYGLIAEEFLRVMQEKAEVPGADPQNLNWGQIIKEDTLIQSPPALWDDIIEAAEKCATLWSLLYRIFT